MVTSCLQPAHVRLVTSCSKPGALTNQLSLLLLLLSLHAQVIKLISRVIADFANGEISQAGSLFDTEVTLEQYLEKSFYKTASLIAASCRSSAVFSQMDEDHKDAMYAYGKHLGLAFQVRLLAEDESECLGLFGSAVAHVGWSWARVFFYVHGCMP